MTSSHGPTGCARACNEPNTVRDLFTLDRPQIHITMPQGDKDKYTDKQKRQAAHIEKSEEQKGKSRKTAERIAWATVNKQDGGGKKGGSGRKKPGRK